jgi:outer membrane protein assembly factor BamB
VRPRVAILLFVALLASCSNPGSGSKSSPTPGSGARTLSPTPTPPATVGTWPVYHRDAARTGDMLGSAPFGSARAGWTSEAVDADVYASPLVLGDTVIVATQNNTVYALALAGGGAIWHTHLGDPVDGNALPCGNIKPITGITGTPVADPEKGLVYVVAFLRGLQHELFALKLADGSIAFHRPMDPPGADIKVLQQRAALALSHGWVYAAYGGLLGDCGRYHGWVVGAHTDGGGQLAVYQVPSGDKAGIWAPSGPAVDSDGAVYVATGNSVSTSNFDRNNAVIKLSEDMRELDFWAPSDWVNLNRLDADVGSTGPALIESAGLIFEAGKAGVGYLIRTSRLGGIGGQAFTGQVCSGGAFGGTAYARSMLHVGCHDGLVALKIQTEPAPSFTVAWRGPRFMAEPPILAGGAVWCVDRGSSTLYALDPASGGVLFKQALGTTMHFTTPAAAPGRVLVAAGRKVVEVDIS